MATLSMFFQGSYPLGLDYNPSPGELIDLTNSQVLSSSSTQVTFQLANGLRVKLFGTGFTFAADGHATGGTLATLQVLQGDGTTVLDTLSGINRPLESFYDAADAYNAWDLNGWLMNGNDTVNGSTRDDDIEGHAGNDTLNGGAGDDFMVGGLGKDSYNGGTGFDTISFDDAYFQPGALHGINVNATAGTVVDQFGNSETFTSVESFRGTQFNDVMVGSAANEQFMGLGGRDNVNGGGGVDEIRYDHDAKRGGNAGVNVNLTTGVAIDGFGRPDTLSNIENVRATNFNDTLVGSAVANQLRGLEGNDSLNGAGGADNMRGGAGNDTYFVDNAGDKVDEQSDNGSGIDRIVSSVSLNLANAAQVMGLVENLTLSGAANIAGTGNGLANSIIGNSGANTLNGAAGNDSMNGGAGNDVLVGGLGSDSLTGGANSDIFLFNAALGATNIDTITDYSAADDTIRLENAIFTALTATGTLSSAAFVANATGAATTTSQRITYETDTGILRYDADGSGAGAAIHFATITGHPALTASEFFVV